MVLNNPYEMVSDKLEALVGGATGKGIWFFSFKLASAK
jgi:hypothetical protein